MDDIQIVELYLQRDESAISHTAQQYGPRLRGLSHGIVADMETAKECENDTYLQAWNSIPPNEPRGYLYAFLARIIRHISIDCCRHRSRLRRSAYVTELSAELEACIPFPCDTESRIEGILLGQVHQHVPAEIADTAAKCVPAAILVHGLHRGHIQTLFHDAKQGKIHTVSLPQRLAGLSDKGGIHLMRGDELLDVLEHLDADLIESAAAPQKRTSMVRLITALAAMLVLVIGIAIMLGEYPNGPSVPDPPYVLSAATLPQLFGDYDSGSTKQYRTIYAESIEALGIDPFEYTNHLGVYQEQKPTITADILTTFVDQSLLNASVLMGEPLEETERWEDIAEDGSNYFIAVDGVNFMARCMFNYTDNNELKLHFSSNNLKQLAVNGKPITLNAACSDDEIKECLADLLNYVNICLDKNYSEILVRRGALTDSVSVYLFDSEENPFPFDFCWPIFASDYITLEFYNPEDENDLLYPNELIFMRRIIPLRNSYELLGQSRMLTLEEAEQHLKKGYIFGAHVCKMCMQSQPEVDFSDYDAVGLEYVKGDNGLTVPFYAFYKDIGRDSSGSQAYAMTYVAAIELEGLEEYFASLPSNHNNP